jgi:hypothetical protein
VATGADGDVGDVELPKVSSSRADQAGCRRTASLCVLLGCLAVEHGILEFVVREIAQVAVCRERFRVLLRVRYRCNARRNARRTGPTCPS